MEWDATHLLYIWMPLLLKIDTGVGEDEEKVGVRAVAARSSLLIFLEHLSHLRIYPEDLDIFGHGNPSEVKQLRRNLRGICLEEEEEENRIENSMYPAPGTTQPENKFSPWWKAATIPLSCWPPIFMFRK